jgi:hypothetical protein
MFVGLVIGGYFGLAYIIGPVGFVGGILGDIQIFRFLINKKDSTLNQSQRQTCRNIFQILTTTRKRMTTTKAEDIKQKPKQVQGLYNKFE